MDTNIIRNANEIMNNGTVISGVKYIEKILSIKSDADKDSCIRLLTFENRHLKLCHNEYSDIHINTIIEDSNYFIFFHTPGNPEGIVGFAILRFKQKKKGKILDIALVCTIPNNKNLARMVAFSIHNFAIKMGCKFLYAVPRTSLLRKTFIKYGFESVWGKEGVDEVLEKEIEDNSITIYRRGKTQKIKRI
jgi:hypothetical protein